MRPTNKIVSLKQTVMSNIILFVILAFGISAGITIHLTISLVEEQYILDIEERASITSAGAKSYLLAGDANGLEKKLQNLNAIKSFNTVHIYQLNDKNEHLTISYNKDHTGNGGYRLIPSQLDKKDTLKEPRISGSIIEILQPILDNQVTIGHIYMQMDAQSLTSLKNTIYICSALSFLLCIFGAIIVSLRIQSKVSSSVDSITSTIQKVSNKKAFDLRCEIQEFQEFEFLARNLNIMLTRTEKHMKKQIEAEQQVLKLNHELEDKVSQRTEALKDSNEELLSTLEKLHQFQGQLVESEKMASLGDMVAGVAHEVNTPIGLGVTASTLLSDKLDEIKECFEDKTLKSSQLKKFLNESQENISIIYRNLNRAADLISSFKKVAVDQSSEEDRQFMVSELINEVLLTLAPQLKNNSTTMIVDCPDNLLVTSKPGPINQILINLIVNSLIHAFDKSSEGIININVMVLSGQLHIQYKDNGKGVDESVKNKVFDPFITTKRGEGGSGLGLHLVYNLVTQALGGSIQFESATNHGVCFDIIFPVYFHESE